MADSIECLSFRAAWCAAASVRPTRLSSRSQLKQGAYRSYNRYTIQLNYKGTGKVATGTGTQYRYWYTAHLKIHC